VEMSETHRSRPLLLRYLWRLCGSPCHNPFSLVIRLCLCLFCSQRIFCFIFAFPRWNRK
jgi:hypothetical protein